MMQTLFTTTHNLNGLSVGPMLLFWLPVHNSLIIYTYKKV